MTRRQAIWTNFWRDSNGRVVVWQWPNRWLWGWLTAEVLSRYILKGATSNLLHDIGSGLLLVWAILEFTRGASYFRRILGAIMLVWIVVSYIHY